MEDSTPPQFPPSPPPLPPTHLDQPSHLLASPPLTKNDSLTLAHFHRLTETQEQEILSNGNTICTKINTLNRIKIQQLFALEAKLCVTDHHKKVR